MKVKVAQLCPTLCDPMDCSHPGFSIHGILQARILEWIAIPFSRRTSQSRGRTLVSCITGRFFIVCTSGNPLKVTQSCLTLCDPMDCSHQALLSTEFSRLFYWSGLPFPSPGDLPNPGIKPGLPHCGQILYQLSHQGSPGRSSILTKKPTLSNTGFL